MIATDQPTIFGNNIIAGVSSKQEGNMSLHSGQDHQHVPMYRRAWLSRLGVSMEQTAVMRVNDPARWDLIYDVGFSDCGKGTERLEDAIVTDALVTNQSGIALLLIIADCNPIMLFDPATQTLALVHGGWQSTDVRLAERVVHHMAGRYGCKPADIQAYIGPAIKKASYIKKDPAQSSDPHWRPFLSQTEDKQTAIDVPGYNRQQLLDAGVLEKNIQLSPVNTATSPDYFSHYRAVRNNDPADDGRFAAVCMIR